MDKNKRKVNTREKRHARVRAKIFGTSERPRLSIFRSNRGIFLQLIDDSAGKTLVSAGDFQRNTGLPAAGKKIKRTKVESAKETGKKLAKLAKEKKIKKAIVDRGGYRYHGRVRASVDGAREGGLKL